MRALRFFALLASLLMTASLSAHDLADVCHASSSYDLTLQPEALLFERSAPAPRTVRWSDGTLLTDGTTVPLRAEDQDRMALFARQLRALVPRVRAIGDRAVDIATQTLDEQSHQLTLSAGARAEFSRQLAATSAQLKQRIATSDSTRDWQGDAAHAYLSQLTAALLPVVVNDLGQQAVSAAMSGDLDGASRLRDEATGVLTRLRPVLEQRMQALRPEVAALCPAIDRLASLQQGVRGANGRPLQLLQVSP